MTIAVFLTAFVFGFLLGMVVGVTVADALFWWARGGTAITSLPSSMEENTGNQTSNPFSPNITAKRPD